MGFFVRGYMTGEQITAAQDYVAGLERLLDEEQDKRQLALERSERYLDKMEKTVAELTEAKKVIAALRGPFDAAPGVIHELHTAMKRAWYVLGSPGYDALWAREILNDALRVKPFVVDGKKK